MTRAIEGSWQAISPYLDEALSLEASQRATWLNRLAEQQPATADQVRSYLAELEQLDKESFLSGDAASMLPSASLAGKRFGSYTLDQPIGHGGMGSVWLAHRSDGTFSSQVAVKLLNAALIAHPAAYRFVRERHVMAQLQHPNIVHLLDAGVATDGQPFLILEYVRGEPIDRYCDRHQLNVRERIRLFLEVLSAVIHAHSHLIVHRDLKPSNILVTTEGKIKLLDFGVAALLAPASADRTHLTQHGPAGLTPGYAAPEQVQGGTITTATDVYALGVILFVLLTGRHPFATRETEPERLLRLPLETDAPRASELAVGPGQRRVLRGDLDNIIAKALRRHPAERYGTADLLAQDLRRYLAFEPVAARAPSIYYLAGRFARRNRAAVSAAATVLLVLISHVTITTRQLVETREQRDRARFESRRAEAANDFLGELLLSGSDPSRPDAAYRERLERGVRLLESAYQPDPRFQGRMLVYIGGNFGTAQDIARADTLYQRGYDIGRAQQDRELMIYALCNRVRDDTYAGLHDGTAARLAEARQLLAGLDRPDADLQACYLMAEGMVADHKGEAEKAEGLLEQARQIVESDGSTYRPIYEEVLAQLSVSYLNHSRPLDSLRLSELMEDIQDHNGRSGTSGRLIAHMNAGAALNKMGEVAGALAQCEQVNQLLRALSDTAQVPVNQAINYAVVLARVNRLPESLNVLNDAIPRIRAAGNPGELLRGLVAQAHVLLESGHRGEADTVIDEIAAAVAAGGAGQYVSTHLELLRMDTTRADLDASHHHRDRALQLAGYQTPNPPAFLGFVLLKAAELAIAEQASADAERFAREALVIFEPLARGPNTSAHVGEALLRLAQSRIKTGSRAELYSDLTRAVASLSNGLTQDHPLTIQARALLASLDAPAH